MLSWQRAIFLLCVAVIEAAPAALVLTIAGGDAWLLLVSIVILAGLAARVLEQRISIQAQRLALFGMALALALWAMKMASGGGANPLSGWNTVTGGAQVGYLTLLCALYAFWRGTFLLDHDRSTVAQVFARIVVFFILVIGVGAFASVLTASLATLAANEILTFFAAGLLAVALANMDGDHNGKKLDWRGFATVIPAVALVLLGGLLLTSFVGGSIGALLESVWQGLVIVALIVLTPFVLLFSWLFEQLANMVNSQALAKIFQQQQALAQQNANRAASQLNIPPWVAIAAEVFCLVIPVLLVALLYLLIRRRKRTANTSNEVRESLLSWGNLASDLSDLLNNMRRKRIAGLAEALASLTGSDPASRIRRSYIRMLLAAEARERPRSAPQTPLEYAPAAADALYQTATPIETLTNAYERARYAPDTATAEDAKHAETTWRSIDERLQREKQRRK